MVIAGVGFKADIPAVSNIEIRTEKCADKSVFQLGIAALCKEGQPNLLNINAWLIGTAAVTLVGSVLVTLLNGKKTYVLAIVLSIVTNGGLAWSMQRLSWGWKNKVDYNGQMTGMPLRMEFVWVWIALHVLILIFALWGMVSKEKSASKKSISRKMP